ncbi:NINE protein [Silvibacterium dinghuense]|uniref:NINE protein n=2 Tax=Silvibacterium dinghuense TaxID=1560006 RepID=A0A4Q1S9Y4_9BACT|nr:NINE protein [Silvibacterium dinghuense]
MSAYQKDEVVGVLLALFLGTFGAHHFYLRRTGLGILYLVFFFTGIPTIVSLVECFFMPGRVRQYNLALANYFAAQMGAGPAYIPSLAAAWTPAPAANTAAWTPAPPAPAPGMTRTCAVCGAVILPEAKFCGRCGNKVA